MMAFWKPNMPMVERNILKLAIRWEWDRLKGLGFYHLLRIQKAGDVITIIVGTLMLVSTLGNGAQPPRKQGSVMVDTSDQASGVSELSNWRMTALEKEAERSGTRQDQMSNDVRILRSDMNVLLTAQQNSEKRWASILDTMWKLIGAVVALGCTLPPLIYQAYVDRWRKRRTA